MLCQHRKLSPKRGDVSHVAICPNRSVFLFLSLIAGCNSSSDNGRLSLSLTDAPVDNAANVVVDITAIQAIPRNGSAITYTFPQPQQIDLLQLQQGVSTPLLYNWSPPPGQYIG